MTENSVRFSLTLDDVVALSVYLADHKPDGRANPWKYGFIWFTAFMLLMIVMAVTIPPVNKTQPDGIPVWIAVIYIGSLGVVLLALMLFRRHFNRFVFRRSLRKEVTPKMSEPQTFVIGPESFTITDSNTTSTSRWDAIQNVALTEEHAFLFIDLKTAHVLPRRAFVSEEDFQELVAEIKRYRAEAT
jgi:hypothetical protein